MRRKTLRFHLCVLIHGFSLHKAIAIDPATYGQEEMERELRVNYRVDSKRVKTLEPNNGWQVNRHDVSEQ